MVSYSSMAPVSAMASTEESDRDRYVHSKIAGIPPDNEYYNDVETYGMEMLESAPYETKCEVVGKAFKHALKDCPEKVLHELLAAMELESFSMADFCWDFAKDYFADLLFVPGKKANAARMR